MLRCELREERVCTVVGDFGGGVGAGGVGAGGSPVRASLAASTWRRADAAAARMESLTGFWESGPECVTQVAGGGG